MRHLGISALFALSLSAMACAPGGVPVGHSAAPLTTLPHVLAGDATGLVGAATSGSTGLVAWYVGSTLSARRIDATGEPLGDAIALGGADSRFVSLAAGDGVFALVRTGDGVSVRRIAEDGTLLDPDWTPLTPAFPAGDKSRSTSVAFDGVQFVADYEQASEGDDFNRLMTLAFPAKGPIAAAPATYVEGDAGYAVGSVGLACAGSVCARLLVRSCLDTTDGCGIPEGPEGYALQVGDKQAFLPGRASLLAASGDRFVVTASGTDCTDLAALIFDTQAQPIGSPVLLASFAHVPADAITFDGEDFALAWVAIGGGAVDVHANWVSPGGEVAFPEPDPAATEPGAESDVALASFGGGASLLATLEGSNVAVRILTKGVGPAPETTAEPAKVLPDGTLGDSSAAAIAGANGVAMVLGADRHDRVSAATVDGSLHVEARGVAAGFSPKMAVAASGTGYLTAISDCGGVVIRRFALDGTPVDPAWTTLPYPMDACFMPLAAGFDGTSYQVYFEGSTAVCDLVGRGYRLAIPAAGPLGSLDDATDLGILWELYGASCHGDTCVALGRRSSQDRGVRIFRSAGAITYAPFGEKYIQAAELGMGPDGGLLVTAILGDSSGHVFHAQRLDKTGAPTGELTPLPFIPESAILRPVLFDGTRFLITWVEAAGIAGNRFDEDGPVSSTAQLLVDGTGVDYLDGPELAPAGEGKAFLAYATMTNGVGEGLVRLVGGAPCKTDAECPSEACAGGVCGDAVPGGSGGGTGSEGGAEAEPSGGGCALTPGRDDSQDPGVKALLLATLLTFWRLRRVTRP